MREINTIDESFDLKHTSEYHLSIQLGLDGFSFCILDIFRHKYIAFQHIPLVVGKLQFLPKKVESIFEAEEILNASYQSVSVTYSTNNATLIPKEYTEPSNLIKIAALTNEISRNEDICSEDLPGFNYQLVYSYPKELMTFLNRKYTEFKFMHKSIPLLSATNNQRNEKKNTLLINFENKYIRMIAIRGSQIDLYNSFYFKTETDFLYYTLNIWHSLQFDPERDEILIGGFVADDSSYVRQLKKYISTIHFLKPSIDFSYGNLFDKIQKHQFISLLNTYLCV
ncbi:MAG TPA: DUF3822 family protein [Prolixibacteraceae bacterium]